MLNNRTNDGEAASSVLSRYLLGESYKNILFRLTIILCAILIIWSGLMVTLIFYIRNQRKKHLQSLLESHFHLYGSKLNLSRNQYKDLKRRSQYHSSKRCHSGMKLLPSSNYSASITRTRTSSIEKTKLTVSFNQTHAIIKAMTKPPLVFNDKVITTTAMKKAGTPFPKINQLHNNESKTRRPTKPSLPNVLGNTFAKETSLYLRPSLSLGDRPDQSFSPKPFRRISIEIRRFSNVSSHSLSTLRTDHQRPLFLNSFVNTLTSQKRRYALSNDQITRSGNYSPHLPLVMITDTNVSYTNIVELDTFEDKQRIRSETERRLFRQLRASCRPRHST